METLKFLMVSSHYPPYYMGGDAVLVRYLSEELTRRGHEVSVLYNPDAYRAIRGRSPSAIPGKDQDGPRRLEYESPFGRLGPVLALSLGLSRGATKKVEEVARELRPDVVHWHNTKGFIGHPPAVKKSANIYTAHDFYSVCPRSNLLRPGAKVCEQPKFCQFCLLRWKKPPQIWRAWSKRVIRFPSEMTLISPSEFLATRLAEDGIAINHVLRNFVPDKRGLVASRRPPKTILFLGVLEVLKGPQILLEAFARSKDYHEYDLCIFGEGSLKKDLMKRVSTLGLEDRIRIPGFVPLERLGPTLEETASLVIPTIAYENAPLAALEAFSMGIPVLGSNLGGLPEILGPESGSMFFKGGSVESLETSLRQLWDRRADLAIRGKKARDCYEEKYSPDIHVREYLNIIGRIER